jgi:hypothetical protein
MKCLVMPGCVRVCPLSGGGWTRQYTSDSVSENKDQKQGKVRGWGAEGSLAHAGSLIPKHL